MATLPNPGTTEFGGVTYRNCYSTLSKDEEEEIEESKKKECPLCLESIAERDRASIGCMHFYHLDGLKELCKYKTQCSTCKAPITEITLPNGSTHPVPRRTRGETPSPDRGPVLLLDEWIGGDEDLEERTDEEDTEYLDLDVSRLRRPLGQRPNTRSRGRPIGIAAAAERRREQSISDLAAFIGARVGGPRGARARRVASAIVRPVVQPPQRRGRPRRVVEPEEDEVALRLLSDNDDAISIRRDMVRPPRRARIESSDEEEEEDGSDSEGDDTEGDSSGSDEESETEEEGDEAILEDRAGPSRRVMDPVERRRRKKKTTKRKTKKTKKTTGEGVTKKRKSPKKRTTRKRKTKGTRRTRGNREETAAAAHRMRTAFPTLSLNGAALEPLSGSDSEPEARQRNSAVQQPSPVASPSVDLLGGIFDAQDLILTNGKHLKQENGKFVPGESYEKAQERKKRRLEKKGEEQARPSSFSSHRGVQDGGDLSAMGTRPGPSGLSSSNSGRPSTSSGMSKKRPIDRETRPIIPEKKFSPSLPPPSSQPRLIPSSLSMTSSIPPPLPSLVPRRASAGALPSSSTPSSLRAFTIPKKNSGPPQSAPGVKNESSDQANTSVPRSTGIRPNGPNPSTSGSKAEPTEPRTVIRSTGIESVRPSGSSNLTRPGPSIPSVSSVQPSTSKRHTSPISGIKPEPTEPSSSKATVSRSIGAPRVKPNEIAPSSRLPGTARIPSSQPSDGVHPSSTNVHRPAGKGTTPVRENGSSLSFRLPSPSTPSSNGRAADIHGVEYLEERSAPSRDGIVNINYGSESKWREFKTANYRDFLEDVKPIMTRFMRDKCPFPSLREPLLRHVTAHFERQKGYSKDDIGKFIYSIDLDKFRHLNYQPDVITLD